MRTTFDGKIMKCTRCGCEMTEQSKRSSKFTARRRRIFRCNKCWSLRAVDEYMRNWRRCADDGDGAVNRQYTAQRSLRGKAYSILMAAKRRAHKNDMQYFSSDADIDNVMARIVNGICEISGVKFCYGIAGRHWNSPSIDRIDSSRGYTIGNVRIICVALNMALNEWGDDGLKKLLSEWLQNGSMLQYLGLGAPIPMMKDRKE